MNRQNLLTPIAIIVPGILIATPCLLTQTGTVAPQGTGYSKAYDSASEDVYSEAKYAGTGDTVKGWNEYVPCSGASVRSDQTNPAVWTTGLTKAKWWTPINSKKSAESYVQGANGLAQATWQDI